MYKRQNFDAINKMYKQKFGAELKKGKKNKRPWNNIHQSIDSVEASASLFDSQASTDRDL